MSRKHSFREFHFGKKIMKRRALSREINSRELKMLLPRPPPPPQPPQLQVKSVFTLLPLPKLGKKFHCP